MDTRDLETAVDQTGLRRVVIEPLSRVEGHGKVTLLMDADGRVPSDPELPLLLDRVHPLHEVVKVDHFIPGCPPSADAIWKFLTDLIEGRTPRLGHGLISYD